MAFSLGNASLQLALDTSALDRGLAGLRGKLSTVVSALGTGAFVGAVAGIAALTGGVVASTAAAVSFESQMAKISTLMTGDGMKWMPQFSAGIQALSREFGESTETLAKGLFDIISAGTAPEKALDLLRVSTKAAAAGITDTATATKAITSVLIGYGNAAGSAASVADKLFASAAAGRLDFEGLAQNIGRVAPQAAQAGLGLDKLLGVFSTISQTSSPEETASLLENLFKAVGKPQKEAVAAAAKFGITLHHTALQGNNLLAMLEKLKGLDTGQLRQIFPDQQAFRAIAALRGQIPFLEKAMSGVGNATGKVDEAFAKVSDTAAFQLAQLKQTIFSTAVSIGTAFLPAVKSIAQSLNGLLQSPALANFGNAVVGTFTKVVNFVKPLWEGFTAGVGTAFAALYGFLKPVLDALRTAVVTVFEAMRPAVSAFLESLRGAGGIITEVGRALVAAFGPQVIAFFQDMRDGVIDALIRVTFALTRWQDAGALALAQVSLGVVTFVDRVKWGFGIVVDLLKWLYDNWREVLSNIANLTVTTFANLTENIGNVLGNIQGLITGEVSFADIWKPLTDGAEIAFSSLPQIAEFQLSATGQALKAGVDQLGGQLDSDFARFQADFLKRMAASGKQAGDDPLGIRGIFDTVNALGDAALSAAAQVAAEVPDAGAAVPAVTTKTERSQFVGLDEMFKRLTGGATTDNRQIAIAQEQLKQQQKQAAAAEQQKISTEKLRELIAGWSNPFVAVAG